MLYFVYNETTTACVVRYGPNNYCLQQVLFPVELEEDKLQHPKAFVARAFEGSLKEEEIEVKRTPRRRRVQ